MRFVTVDNIKPGDILGNDLYGKSGEVLLSKKVVLKPFYIKKIKEMGYNGVYIDDESTDSNESIEIISERLKIETVQNVKTIFQNKEKGINGTKDELKKLSGLIDSISDELISNRNLPINLTDIKIYDDYTFYHSVNVAILSGIFGIELQLNRTDLYKLCLGAILHDIGKVYLDKKILNKKGKLTLEEYETVKTHSEKGYKLLKDEFDISIKSYIGVYHHHEKYDGTGYPLGLKGDEISLFGRIICLSDVYDATDHIEKRYYLQRLLNIF